MPRTLETTVYQFSELSESAKEKARDWMREHEQQDFEPEMEAYETAARLLGIDLMVGKTRKSRKNPNELIHYQANTILYSGFSSQGDGASFTGTYTFKPGLTEVVRGEFPKDTELHAIADALQVFQCRMVYDGNREWEGKITQNDGRYCHKYTMSAEVYDAEGEEMDAKLSKAFTEIMRDFAQWIYDGLEADYDWRLSDEAIDETIEANDYEFTEEGKLA